MSITKTLVPEIDFSFSSRIKQEMFDIFFPPEILFVFPDDADRKPIEKKLPGKAAENKYKSLFF